MNFLKFLKIFIEKVNLIIFMLQKFFLLWKCWVQWSRNTQFQIYISLFFFNWFFLHFSRTWSCYIIHNIIHIFNFLVFIVHQFRLLFNCIRELIHKNGMSAYLSKCYSFIWINFEYSFEEVIHILCTILYSR